jgi:hypothetical protein
MYVPAELSSVAFKTIAWLVHASLGLAPPTTYIYHALLTMSAVVVVCCSVVVGVDTHHTRA